jgi:hypothetical protein
MIFCCENAAIEVMQVTITITSVILMGNVTDRKLKSQIYYGIGRQRNLFMMILLILQNGAGPVHLFGQDETD